MTFISSFFFETKDFTIVGQLLNAPVNSYRNVLRGVIIN